MLMLGRREGETFWIGDTLVRICQIKGSAVRVGIEAPQHVKVVRGEIRHLPPKKEAAK